MHVIFAGPRDFEGKTQHIDFAVAQSGWTVTKVIAGGAQGVDTLAVEWAKAWGIEYEVVEAEWKRYGPRRGGRIRNRAMEPKGERLIALWDGASRGTGDMVAVMERAMKPVYIQGIRGYQSHFRWPVTPKRLMRVHSIYGDLGEFGDF